MKEPTLRDYQAYHVQNLVESCRVHKNVIFVAPTGYGKTHCFTYLVSKAVKNNRRVWVMAHLKEILTQVSERFSDFGIPHSWIAAGKGGGDHPVKLVMAQTAVARKAQLEPPERIISDECHRELAKTRTELREYFPEARCLGVTATPCRSDGRGLGEAYTDMVHTMQIAELVEINRVRPSEGLVPTVTYCPPNDFDASAVKSSGSDFSLVSAALQLDKARITGDAIEHYKRICPGARGIYFEATVERAQESAERFTAAGIPAAAIDGSMDDYRRAAIYRAFGAGTIRALFNVNLFLEGVDIPGIEFVGWLRPTKSPIIWRQGNGRGMRPAFGKQYLIVFDHVGNTYRLGLPGADAFYTLDGIVKQKRGEAGKHLKRCEECHAQFEPGPKECPQCGATVAVKERKIIMVAGELVPTVDDEKLQELLIREKEKDIIRRDLRKCHSLSDCIDFAATLGKDRQFGLYLWKRKNAWRKKSAQVTL